MSIEKIKTEHRVEKLEKENVRLKDEVNTLKERVENLSMMFFHLKDDFEEHKKIPLPRGNIAYK